ncbi:zinc knuckle CX2CX4HX4C containing protein [Tanacetum coccineum]
MNDDTPMCKRHEANYIELEGYQNQNSHDSYYDPKSNNDSEKLLTELNYDVKQDLEHFKSYLGANVNIMSKSVLEELSLAKPKNANVIVEMANKTRRVPQGIIENVSVKIDKFSFSYNFVIIDTKELNNKTIILGRSFLANIHAEINVSTREVSLWIEEDRVKIKMNKHERDFTTSASEHLNKRPTSQEIQTDIYDTDLHESCILDNQSQDKLTYGAYLEWEGLSCTNWVRARYEKKDPEKCGETKTRAIIEEMVNKSPEKWFSGVSKDKDDLKGIIDYLEPTLYDGFIDHNDESYKQRRNKLLGMPYTEPPPIVKEEAMITRYNLGAGENPEARRQLLRPA